MIRKHALLAEILTAIALIAAPYVLPHLGFTPNTINRILVWGLFGLGFDILFGIHGTCCRSANRPSSAPAACSPRIS